MALGEATKDVFVIGSPELDVHKAPSGVDIQTVRKRYDIDFEDYGIVLFHPVTSEQDTIGVQAPRTVCQPECFGTGICSHFA